MIIKFALILKVEDKEPNNFAANGTNLRINAKTFWMNGTTERLAFKIPDLLIAVGGFLGLFVGLSLLDVVNSFIDRTAAVSAKA